MVRNKSYQQKRQTPTHAIQSFKENTDRMRIENILSGKKKNSTFIRPVMNEKVQFWINYYTKRNPGLLKRHFQRASLYKKDIQGIFAEHGLPKELFYVGIIESGYSMHAKSHASAVGPWQFVKDTAKRYGLNVNHVIDERRNIIKATHAASEYFKDLYNIFGSWELALSAYNAGEYGIIRRIRKAGTRDYYELSEKKIIPRETRNYVPKLQAVMTIAKNPDRYGFRIPEKGSYLASMKQISLKGSTSLKNLSSKLGISTRILKKYNPELISYRTPYYKNDDLELLVPKSVKKSELTFKESRKVAQRSTHYRVKKGDNLINIAKRFKTTVTSLKESNSLTTNRIYIGQRLKVDTRDESKVTKSYQIYTVKRGDHLNRIARRFNTTWRSIKRINKISKNTIYPGQKLRVPDVEHLTYTVKRGDHLHKIARNFKTSISEIRKLNSLRSSKIYPGQNLVVSVK
jgi:membrane-bound lytic murein transglycosylase D